MEPFLNVEGELRHLAWGGRTVMMARVYFSELGTLFVASKWKIRNIKSVKNCKMKEIWLELWFFDETLT